MIMNLSAVESNENGRVSSSMTRRNDIQRVEPSRPQSLHSPSLDVTNSMKACHDIQTGEVYAPTKAGDSCSSGLSMTMDGSSVLPEATNQIHSQCISAPQLFSPSAHDELQTVRSPTGLSQTLFSLCDTGSKKRCQNPLNVTSNKALKQEVTIPLIYKLARKCLWYEFERCLMVSSEEDINFVYAKDGTTIMHMVVMSRTGYINAFKSSSSKDFDVAPNGLLEQLLQRCPQLAKVQCSLNGYTPLTYACLVCDDKYPMEIAASMVRLLLDHSPDAIHLFSKDGLSPVDIHVVSYSYHHPDKEDRSSRGRSSATLLRALLSYSPELARNRVQGDKITGPIELLYKCNAKSFSQEVLDEINEAAKEGNVHSVHTLPERRQIVVEEVKKWWIWTWSVMLLKYGSEGHRKWGTQFAAVHAASIQIGCPSPLIKLALVAFPRQATEPIADKDDLGNFPLHAVCSWPCGTALKSASRSLIDMRKSQAITILMEEYPAAAAIANSRGDLPLELAVRTNTTWDGGIRRLVKTHPKALCRPSQQTGMYPFLTCATSAKQSASLERQLQSLRTVYGLLRSNPQALTLARAGINQVNTLE